MRTPARTAILLALAAACARGGRLATASLEDRGGVGTEPQPAPYDTPAVALGPVNGAPHGTLSAEAFYSSRIYPGFKFRYRIYVPALYRAGHPAALMVFQDGNTWLGVLRTAQVFDNLIHAGDMPVTIALFIDPGTPSGVYVQAESRELRSREYDTLDDTYARFLVDEIVPDVVLNAYTVTRDPDGWAVGGQSSGGIAAFTAAWQRPDRFHRVLTANGSFTNIRGGNTYPDLIRASDRKALRVYLSSGTNDLNNQFGSWMDANTAMAAALEERGYAYRYRTGTGGHFPPLQALADYPDALRWLWHGYTPPTTLDLDLEYRHLIQVPSSIDHTPQPSYLLIPPALGGTRLALAVMFHTWSFDLEQRQRVAEEEAIRRGWLLLTPNFRGRDDHPEACGSALAQQDVLDAVQWVRQHYPVDSTRIYALGLSGGGYMTMLMAARAPHLWAAASAWVGISDLPTWYAAHEGDNYGVMTRQCLGGPPSQSDNVAAEYRARSPLTWLTPALSVPLDLAAGRRDSVVAIRHSLRAFNAIAPRDGAVPVSDAEMDELTGPAHALAHPTPGDTARDSLYGRAIVLRRTAGRSRVTIFDGGHEWLPLAAMAWLAQHQKGPRF